MITDTEQRIVNIRNEIQAQKTAQELAYSQLLMPENTPSATYSGTITSGAEERYDTMARVRARFTRSDGVDEPPFVNFPFSLTFIPSYKDFVAQWGEQVTGDDVDFADEQCYIGYVAGTGSNYVDFYIDIPTEIVMTFAPFTSLDFTVTVEAVANVAGTLSMTRLL